MAVTPKKHVPELITDFASLRKKVAAMNTYIGGAMEWVTKNRRLKGEPFSFIGREYLQDVYGAVEKGIQRKLNGGPPARILIKKCVQSEFTETMVNILIWFLLKYPHTVAIYTAPRQDQVNRVSKDRIRAAINESPEIAKRVNPNEQDVTRIKFDNGSVLYMYSSWSGADALRNIPADIVVGDEIQDMDEVTFGVLESRLDHSRYGVYILLGSPKIPGTEFERLWKQSNQQEWVVKCPTCGYEQVLDRESIIDVDGQFRGEFRCKRHEWRETGEVDEKGKPIMRKVYTCNAPMIRGKAQQGNATVLLKAEGRWVPTKPENTYWVGFHVSQYMVPWKTADELWGRWTYYRLQQYVNEIEGEFYSGSQKPITPTLIFANIQEHNGHEYRMPDTCDRVTVMGIDWMNYPVLTIIERVPSRGDPKGLRRIIFTKSWEGVTEDDTRYLPEIAELVKRYNVGRIVADMGYGITQNKWLRRKFHNKVYGVWYKQPGNSVIKETIDEETGLQILSADRTYFSEEVIDNFEKHRYIIPYADPAAIEWAFEQWCAIERENVKTQGKEYARYTHNDNNADHAFHTLVYCEIALSNLIRPMDLRGARADNLFWGGGNPILDGGYGVGAFWSGGNVERLTGRPR